jgi:acyl-CoA oxidase
MIESADQRFGLALGALGTGRVCVIYSAVACLQFSTKVALRFSAMRQQFGKPNEPEMSLIEYPLQQYRVFPHLARGTLFLIATQRILELWGKN